MVEKKKEAMGYIREEKKEKRFDEKLNSRVGKVFIPRVLKINKEDEEIIVSN